MALGKYRSNNARNENKYSAAIFVQSIYLYSMSVHVLQLEKMLAPLLGGSLRQLEADGFSFIWAI